MINVDKKDNINKKYPARNMPDKIGEDKRTQKQGQKITK